MFWAQDHMFCGGAHQMQCFPRSAPILAPRWRSHSLLLAGYICYTDISAAVIWAGAFCALSTAPIGATSMNIMGILANLSELLLVQYTRLHKAPRHCSGHCRCSSCSYMGAFSAISTGPIWTTSMNILGSLANLFQLL